MSMATVSFCPAPAGGVLGRTVRQAEVRAQHGEQVPVAVAEVWAGPAEEDQP